MPSDENPTEVAELQKRFRRAPIYLALMIAGAITFAIIAVAVLAPIWSSQA